MIDKSKRGATVSTWAQGKIDAESVANIFGKCMFITIELFYRYGRSVNSADWNRRYELLFETVRKIDEWGSQTILVPK